jgi:hypothetical protein
MMDGPPVARSVETTPVLDRCENCGAVLAGPYCHQCGQRDVDHLASVREFAAHLAEVVVGYDSRLLRTVRVLFTRPGFLTAEYVAGRRVRYIPPLQLYLGAAALLFATNVWRPMVTFNPATRSFRSGLATFGVTNVLTRAELAEIAAKGMSLELFGERFANSTTSHLSTFLVLLVPVFALCVAAAFVGSRRPFAHHVLFSLHWSAFSLCVLALLQLVPARLTRTPVGLIIDFGVPLAYFIVAMRRAYHSSWQSAADRGIVLYLVYQFILVAWLNFVTVYTRHHL